MFTKFDKALMALLSSGAILALLKTFFPDLSEGTDVAIVSALSGLATYLMPNKE